MALPSNSPAGVSASNSQLVNQHLSEIVQLPAANPNASNSTITPVIVSRVLMRYGPLIDPDLYDRLEALFFANQFAGENSDNSF